MPDDPPCLILEGPFADRVNPSLSEIALAGGGLEFKTDCRVYPECSCIRMSRRSCAQQESN